MLPIHDHHVRELTIKVLERTIRLRTAFPETTSAEVAEVAFEGVEGYVFRGDVLGTVLFDVEHVDALTLYRNAGYENVREEIADAASNKTLGGGIRRYHFTKRL